MDSFSLALSDLDMHQSGQLPYYQVISGHFGQTSLGQIVSSCAETIPEKVKISRPINGVKKSEMNLF